jgi:L-alanine-DL-glutamate epimerase-like enolase superfamily enzyme
LAVAAIERIEAHAIGLGGAGYAWAGDLAESHVVTTFVRVFDEAGSEGVGATASYTERAFDLSVLESLGPLILAALERDSSHAHALAVDVRRRPLPTAPGAHSALDIAFWDLAAKRAGVPLYQLLGGEATRIRAYGSSPFFGQVDTYLSMVEELQQVGLRGIKFHAWCEPNRDLELISAISDTHRGGPTSFMLDAEQRYDRRSALRVARALDEEGWEWLEAPLDDHDIPGYRELRRRVVVPVMCSGNWLWRPPQVLAAISAEAWHAVHFDVTVAGGITSARTLLALAAAAALPVELQSWGHTVIQAANLHVAVAGGRTHWFELALPYEAYETAVLDPIRPDADGFVSAPTGPGLGVEIDWEHIASIALASRSWRKRAGAGDPDGSKTSQEERE